MVRLRIDLAYDGGGFHGWAKQPTLRTVQGEVEHALHLILHVPEDDPDEPLRLTVAGRTDTGVHATHQVCHLDVSQGVLDGCVGHMAVPGHEALRRRLSRMLPPDIAIHAVAPAPDGFDARFSALERTYVYRICDGGRLVDPRMRGFVLAMDGRLDLDAMNEAAAMTIGLHDFGSFATPNPGGTTIRNVLYARWSRIPATPLVPADMEQGGGSGAPAHTGYVVPSAESGLVTFTIVADAFARNMVRSLVNACVKVGLSDKSLDWFAEKMRTPLREGSTGPIAPQGLTLEHIAYPPDDRLASRAEAIRARRTL